MSKSLVVTLVQAHNLATLAQNFTASRGESWVSVEHSSHNVGAALWWGRSGEGDTWSKLGCHLGKVRLEFTVTLPSGSLLA